MNIRTLQTAKDAAAAAWAAAGKPRGDHPLFAAAMAANRALVAAQNAARDAVAAGRVMIGGAPFLMAPLEAALREQGLTPVYAFSMRESVEEVQPDGSIRKTAVFRHLGFVGE